MQTRKLLLPVFLMVVIAGCGTPSPREFRQEGQGVVRKIILELQPVTSSRQLEKKQASLKKLFERLVDIIIEARQTRLEHPQIWDATDISKDHMLSDTLREQLNRVYRIPGCREIIETSQSDALLRLDACEKSS